MDEVHERVSDQDVAGASEEAEQGQPHGNCADTTSHLPRLGVVLHVSLGYFAFSLHLVLGDKNVIKDLLRGLGLTV